MTVSDKVMIVAPFWHQQGHVGVYRVDRFVRWLSAKRVQIILVRAGSEDGVLETPWGVEITVRDPLGLYRDASPGGSTPISPRKPNKLRRLAVYLLFNPDPTVVWAKRAARHPEVMKHGEGVRWVLSSSPPESAHVASASLAKQLNAELIVDMRDGWLDEPLKPLLQHSRFQQWREGRLESRILRQAKKIFVTSEVWKDLLNHRLPFTKGKTVVLTNGYPPVEAHSVATKKIPSPSRRVTLLHAGRFSGSSGARKVSHLLKPLFLGTQGSGSSGVIIFLGNLAQEDLAEVAHWKPRFEAQGWSLEVRAAVPRDIMMKQLCEADGLLLLSASHAAIPSKLFEYLPTGRPILAATLESSAVWKLSKALPQVFSLEYSQPQRMVPSVRNFIRACMAEQIFFEVPKEYSEEYLSKIFLKEVRFL